jgi:hypothetical protein
MPVVNSYNGNTPTVGADVDTWGGELNTALGQIDTTLDNFVTAINATETALLRGGGTMTGDIVLADVGPGNALSGGFRGLPTVSFDADRTLQLTDAGKAMRVTGTTARTITIPPNSGVAFPVGTTIPIRSFSTAAITIARGSGVELRLALSATNANRTVASYGMATIYQEAANIWVITGSGVS